MRWIKGMGGVIVRSRPGGEDVAVLEGAAASQLIRMVIRAFVLFYMLLIAASVDVGVVERRGSVN